MRRSGRGTPVARGCVSLSGPHRKTTHDRPALPGTPNGLTLTLFLQETGIEHRIIAVDIGAGEQMACYPWVVPHEAHGQDLVEFPNLRRWFDTIAVRPATQRAYKGVTSSYSRSRAPMSDEARTILFGQR